MKKFKRLKMLIWHHGLHKSFDSATHISSSNRNVINYFASTLAFYRPTNIGCLDFTSEKKTVAPTFLST